MIRPAENTLLHLRLDSFGAWPLWLSLCLLSRVVTSIHYISDPDSLRFAQAVLDFDLANLQPHFPGYPVFCFLVKGVYAVIGRFAYAFALVGGLATFLLIYSGQAIYKQLQLPGKSLSYLLLLFLNPMLWIMANRYMPDLLGAAMVMACFAIYLTAKNGNQKAYLVFFVLTGLLAGVRLSYLPMVFLPVLLLLITPKWYLGVLAGVVAVLLWFVPMLLDTGWQTLLDVALNHTDGHFNQWGGTVISEPSHAQRLSRTLQFTWATGLGGFWAGRNWLTSVFSLALISASAWAVVNFFRSINNQKFAAEKSHTNQANHLLIVLVFSGLIYLIWIYFYQNVVHQSRHVLLLLPLLLLLPAAGIGLCLQTRFKWALGLPVLLLIVNAWLTVVLVMQHRSPTAISQVKEHLINRADAGDVVVSLDMINFYLNAQKVPAELLSIENDQNRIHNLISQGKPVWFVGDFREMQQYQPHLVQTFYHNPYVNSLWPEISLYRYQRK